MEQRRNRRPGAVLISERDRVLLAFASRHRLVHTRHIAALLEVTEKSAHAILTRLETGGYLRGADVYEGHPACYRIRQTGIDAIGGGLQAPGKDLRAYEHDVGLAWLWLAARDGAFGRVREIIAERELRSHDTAPQRSGPPLAVRLGGVGRGGSERLHYPDLLLRRADGRTVAIELELTSKGRTRLEGILGGYAADGRIDAVLYLVRNRTIGNGVLAAARKLGIDDIVFVQLVQDDSLPSAAGPARAPSAARSSAPVRRAAPRDPAVATERGL